MAYLRSRDLDKQIQSDNLNQIISNDAGILTLAELAAQEECESYLSQKYNILKELTDTNPWNRNIAYAVSARFELNFADYVPATSYAVNDLVTNNSLCYICAVVTTGAFDPTKWTLLGAKYDIFYAKAPHPEFNVYNVYSIGDQIYFNGNTYTCKIATIPINENESIQYLQYKDIPNYNIFPNDPVQGLIYWGAPVAYSVPAGTLPTNTTYYMLGDNRSQQLVLYMIDIVLYHVHSRIAQRNIPTQRESRYNAAIAWLGMANSGQVTANIEKLQPYQGRAIRFGGNVKTVNTY